MTRSGDRDPTYRHVAEVEVPANPEDVWTAVATGEGTATWLFAADIDPRVGGSVTIHRAPFGPDAAATVTGWDPPHRFAYEEQLPDRDGSGSPPLATEFLVEGRGGGTCVVRVVSSIAGDSDDWEDLLEGATSGWRMSLLVLASYLAHFSGTHFSGTHFSGSHLSGAHVSARPAANLDLIVDTHDRQPGSDGVAVLARLVERLGLAGQVGGDSFRTKEGAPAAAGTIEHADSGFVLLRTSEPCPGLLAISTLPMDGVTVTVNVLGRLFGPDAAVVAERERDRWKTWLTEMEER
jgi:uncharacterized protein YndB with AHSA1/START domain